jgi:hypothetical protein
VSLTTAASAPTGIRPVRRGQPLLAAACALVFFAVVAAVVFLMQRTDKKIEVVQVTAAVPVGDQVTSITPVEVAADSGIRYVPWSQRGQLSGYVAAVALVAGQPLLGTELTAGTAMPSGDELVGLEIAAGNYPSGLASGEKVSVRAVAAAGTDTGTGGSSLTASPMLFNGAPVASVLYSQGTDPTSSTALVNLYVTPSEANALATGRGTGTIMLTVDGGS